MVTARFADVLGESKIPVLDLASNYDELGKFLTQRIAPDFEPFGLQIVALMVENISLPPEVEKVLDQRTGMGIVGDLHKYTQFQTAQAIGDAARNPGGLAGAGAGMGAGFAMANQMGQAMAAPTGQSTAHPPPVPQQSSASYFVALEGKQAGPFTAGELGGKITRDTLVWRQGMAQWTRAADVAELRSLVESMPPPLP
jgi:membrane protease subunit (stomatin/prohibitin family)